MPVQKFVKSVRWYKNKLKWRWFVKQFSFVWKSWVMDNKVGEGEKDEITSTEQGEAGDD